MPGQLIGYARVSTAGQDLALQIDALKAAGCTRIFEEKASGVRAERPQLAAAMDYMRPGDTLVVWKLDRLGRSLKQLVTTIEAIKRDGINFRSLTEAMDTNTTQGKMVFGIMSTLAEFERDLIRDRVNAGLSAARRQGRVGGRPPVSKDALAAARQLVVSGTKPRDACKIVGISTASYYKHRPQS